MPFVLLTVAAQVIAVVHLFRTRRDMRWLFLIILVPMVGCLAYFFIEVLPSLRNNPAARRALQKARAAELFAAVLKDARLAPAHFRRAQREWIELAEREQR